ncbi:MAG: hypothetical protein E6J82_01555, partial [Deltaproteobacteria bacterium]
GWRNNGAKRPGFQVALDGRRSQSRYAIGARVEIRSPDGRRQVREVKGSGGYASYDAPVACFGLGDWPAVASIKVTWPDGDSSAAEGSFGSARYTLVRLPDANATAAIAKP